MKRLLKIILAFFLGVLFYSCDKEKVPEIPGKEKNTVRKYVYHKEYRITDLNLYAGDKGEKLTFSEVQAKRYWKSLDTPEGDSIILDLKKDTLIIKSNLNLSPIMYRMIHRNDSIYILRNNGRYTFLGEINKDSTEITTHAGYYVIFKPNTEFIFGYYGKGRDYQLQSYEERFYKNGWFESPSDMTSPGDTVAWCNVFYKYHKIP